MEWDKKIPSRLNKCKKGLTGQVGQAVLRNLTVSRKDAPVKQMQKRFNRAGNGAMKDIFVF